MVNEREPPKVSVSPVKMRQQVRQQDVQPEFGKASTLQSPLAKSVFNIPKSGQARPEHHLGAVLNNAKNRQPVVPSFRYPFEPPVYVPARSTVNISSDEDVVEIQKPVNIPSWPSYVPHVRAPMYSSLDDSVGGFASVNQTRREPSGNYVDLTDSTLFHGKFGEPNPYDYVDTAKATENIKALLEGAFDDDEDKPKTRGRKKKLEEKATQLVDELRGFSVKSDAKPKVDDHDKNEEEEEEEDDGSIEGLRVKLLPHQVDGVEWMKDKETGKRKKNGVLPKGGILADDMGLGKTIQSIALLLTNPRPPLSSMTAIDTKHDKDQLSSSVCKGTLVVAPLALIKQWEAEIANRVTDSHRLRVCVHHGPQRTKRFEDLRKYDVVITTYQILVSEHNNSSHEPDEPQFGCFGLYWYRVILDEAHTIKNRNAKATQACYALRTEYRWCLTGTPMQNNLDELQSLIKFLRIKPYNDLGIWRDQITRPLAAGRGGVAMKRLQFYLKAFMKRRTKDILKGEGALNPGGKAAAEGKPNHGFKITERKIQKVVAEFTGKERQFYERLEARADESLEKMMGGKTLNYASALVLLLRLRQACNHPELVGGSMAKDKDALTTGQIAASQSPRKSKNVDRDLDDMADLLGSLSMQTKQCDVCQLELTKDEARSGMIRCSTCEDDLADFKGGKANSKKLKKPIYLKLDAQKPSRRERNRLIVKDSDDENDEGEGDWVLAKGQRNIPKLGKASGSDDENAEDGGEWLANDDTDTGDEASIVGSKSQKSNVITLNSTDKNPSDRSVDASEEDDTDDDHDSEEDVPGSGEPVITKMMTSTKIRHLLKILRRESKAHKFIVFSQFTSMLNLIEPFLNEEGFIYTRYDGSMRNDLREASLERLRTDKRTRILLCSLKCGSLGLNLTAASRVVILEPFWNPFVEEQAIDRVHRLNQTIDVVVYKITIANSVEERILDLQGKKRALAEAAIEGKAVAKLSMQDILRLFRRDAEHDPTHDTHAHLVPSARVLPAVASAGGSVRAGESRRSMPPVMERLGKESGKPKADTIYGRRW